MTKRNGNGKSNNSGCSNTGVMYDIKSQTKTTADYLKELSETTSRMGRHLEKHTERQDNAHDNLLEGVKRIEEQVKYNRRTGDAAT
jgi:hypothetical protein